MDWSTINLTKLRRRMRCVLPSFFYLGESPGHGCAGDPPGYPTYYTRCVYTRQGDTPQNAPQYVIAYDDELFIVGSPDSAQLRDLWSPLPPSHPRTRLWIESTYRHHHHCYDDADNPEYGRPGTLIFPVPSYSLERHIADVRCKDEYLAAVNAEIDARNKAIIDRATAVASPENHQAVRIIQRFYPDYEPEQALIDAPPKSPCFWWETEAEQPSEADCASTQRWKKEHLLNGTWCQWCGRSYASE